MIEDAMIDTEFGSSFLLNENINKLSSGSSYVKIECNTTNSDFDNYCNSLFDEYNVNEMYILKNEETFINSLKNDVSTQTFKEYLEYLDNIGVYNNGYSKLLVVETYVINDDKNILNKYAYLPIK